MGLSAKSVNNNAKEQAPVGNHLARVVGLVDLGHQPGFVYDGKEIESKYKIQFIYELVSVDMEDGRPFWVEEDVNVSDYEPKKPGQVSSTMMKRVRALDGYDGDSNNGKELAGLINKPCMVEVFHNDKGYAKIRGVSPTIAGIDVADLRNTPVVFNMDEAEHAEIFLKFSDYKKGIVSKALDFEGSPVHAALLESGQWNQQPDV